MTVTDQGPETVIGHLFAPRAARIEPILSTTRQDELRKRAADACTRYEGLPVPHDLPKKRGLRNQILSPRFERRELTSEVVLVAA